MPIFLYESCAQTAASQRATSRGFHGRWIGRADGPDQASCGHFSKKPLCFLEINPRSRGPLSIFFKKHLRLFRNQPAVQIGWLRVFCKEDLIFIENQPALQRPSQQFLRKPPHIFLKSIFKPPLIISLFKKIN